MTDQRKPPPTGCVDGEYCPTCGGFPERTYQCENCGKQCCGGTPDCPCSVCQGHYVCCNKCADVLAAQVPNPTDDIVAELRRIGDKIELNTRVLGSIGILYTTLFACNHADADAFAPTMEMATRIIQTGEKRPIERWGKEESQ